MQKETIFYRRNLPHIQPKGGTFFVTFRLEETIPEQVLQALLADREKQINNIDKKLSDKERENEKYKAEKRFFAGFDQWLDKCKTGPTWLKTSKLARTVAEKIHDLDGTKYKLIAYSIMSNHVHLLIDLAGFEGGIEHSGKTKAYPLADALRLLKGSTSRSCNLLLNRTGQFWHHESYDHYVRDEDELFRIIEYILYNPVKAGLVESYQDWEFSFLCEAFST